MPQTTAQSLCLALAVMVIFSWGWPVASAQDKPSNEKEIPLPISRAKAFLLNVPVNIELGKKSFQSCGACHALGQDAKSDVGPNLDGIVGRKAASIDSYEYSDALSDAAESGLIWDAYRLDAYLASPALFIEGNKMAFVGIQDENERRNLIAYLKTFR